MNSQDFTLIWNNFQDAIGNFIKSKVSDEDHVKDIQQDVFLKFIQAKEEGKKIRNIQQWLFQVTRNTISDHFRKHYKVNKVELDHLELETERVVDGCVCDITGFIIKNYLPSEYATPLYLSDIEKMPQTEIAKKLKLSISGAKSRIQRGRKMLKDLIIKCVIIDYNNKGEVVNFQLKPTCKLPEELENEMKKYKISI